MRDTYGWVCLVLGAALVILQFILMWHDVSTTKKEGEAHKELAKAARNLTEASSAAALAVSGAGANLDLMQDEVSKATTTVAAAREDVKVAADNSSASKWDTATALANRVPLAVVGVVMITLGALITGNLDFSAAASTK